MNQDISHYHSGLPPTSGKYRSCSLRSLPSLNCSQSGNPDAVLIVSGDFNQTNLKKIMPDVHQHIDWATKGINTLNLCYTPFCRQSKGDHVAVLLRCKPTLTHDVREATVPKTTVKSFHNQKPWFTRTICDDVNSHTCSLQIRTPVWQHGCCTFHIYHSFWAWCQAFKCVNTRKEARPDGISGRVLKLYADQVAPMFTAIFKLFLNQSVIPTCLK